MNRWGNQDLASNTSKQYALTTFNQGNTSIANGAALWHNTTPSAFTNGQVVGLYGVTNTMLGVADKSTAGKGTPSPGWVLVKQGTGPVNGVSASPGGVGYSNTDVLTISGNNCVNATFHPVTNATGGIVSFTTNNAGFGFPNTAYATVAMANSLGGASAGSGATITFTLGGRAGRVKTEVLVVTPSMTSACSSALFPNT